MMAAQSGQATRATLSLVNCGTVAASIMHAAQVQGGNGGSAWLTARRGRLAWAEHGGQVWTMPTFLKVGTSRRLVLNPKTRLFLVQPALIRMVCGYRGWACAYKRPPDGGCPGKEAV